MHKLIAGVLAASLLSGCASMVDMVVVTDPPGAEVNVGGYVSTSPVTVPVGAKHGVRRIAMIEARKPGYRPIRKLIVAEADPGAGWLPFVANMGFGTASVLAYNLLPVQPRGFGNVLPWYAAVCYFGAAMSLNDVYVFPTRVDLKLEREGDGGK